MIEILIYIATMISTNIIIYNTAEYTKFYTLYPKIQPAIFSSFLAMGSFMLALITLFLISLKEKFFDSKEYEKIIILKRHITNEKYCKYTPLINISKLFILCIFICFLTSLTQITIGLFNNLICKSFCLSIAITTILLILFSLYHVWRTIKVWLSHLSKDFQ